MQTICNGFAANIIAHADTMTVPGYKSFQLCLNKMSEEIRLESPIATELKEIMLTLGCRWIREQLYLPVVVQNRVDDQGAVMNGRRTIRQEGRWAGSS